MKKVIIIALVLGLAGAIYGYYLYNKPVASLENARADHVIGADQLFAAFRENEQDANEKYLNKVVEIAGIVKEVSREGTSQNIILQTHDPLSAILCEMNELVEGAQEGMPVKIKGQCAGYLLDVVLTKCIIVNE